MELVAGETLSQRIHRKSVPVDEALGIAREIAEGLEYAHDHGIVHRDLKPANVKITPEGRVKMLDFGLAKAYASDRTAADFSESPTLSAPATEQGVILGTAAYMSPEQARGRVVDRRTDIWALGCVLFEMLTAKRAFAGDNVTDILAGVVKGEPDWTLLPAGTPQVARALLRSCLQKDPRRRCQHVGDARIAIEDAMAQPATSADMPATTAHKSRPLWRRAVPVLAAAIVVGSMASAVTWYVLRPGAPAVVRFSLILPEERQVSRLNNMLALSPDGTQLAYAAGGQLFLHDLAGTEARVITGKDSEVQEPVFSPDGSWIAFWSRNDLTLKKIAVTGGMAVPLCDTDGDAGSLSWHREGIVFTTLKGILQVSENGGEPQLLVPSLAGEVFDSPQFLDGGETVLFTIAKGQTADRWDKAQIVAQRLPSVERKVIVDGGSGARFVPTGHLVYALGGTLLAIPFDPRSLETTGRAVPVADGILRSANPASTPAVVPFVWSSTGTFAYFKGQGSGAQQRIALVDQSGTVQPLPLPARPWVHPRVSPDGSQLVVGADDGKDAAVWIYALKGGGEPRRLTFEGRNTSPIWMPDGKHVTFQSDREGGLGLFKQQADGAKAAERLVKSESGFSLRPEAWTKDGTLAFLKSEPPGLGDIWMLPPRGAAPKPLVEHPESNQRYAAFHPEGQWFAYVLGTQPRRRQLSGFRSAVSTDGGQISGNRRKQLRASVVPRRQAALLCRAAH